MGVCRTSPVDGYLKQGITDVSEHHWYLHKAGTQSIAVNDSSFMQLKSHPSQWCRVKPFARRNKSEASESQAGALK